MTYFLKNEESIMIDGKRYYRKKLTSHGLIYLAGKELDISIKNLSITGVLAELKENNTINSIVKLFDAIGLSSKVDIYLSEMNLMGDAEVVRADLIDGIIYLALEFRNISYEMDSMLYKRRVYRKTMIASGLIAFNGENHNFTTRNVSVCGLMIHLPKKIEIKIGTVTEFNFKHLSLHGEIKVIWVEDAEKEEGMYVGLEYVHMENTRLKVFQNLNIESLI
jgi:hypothetical protein